MWAPVSRRKLSLIETYVFTNLFPPINCDIHRHIWERARSTALKISLVRAKSVSRNGNPAHFAAGERRTVIRLSHRRLHCNTAAMRVYADT
jgi:hypothetical protein